MKVAFVLLVVVAVASAQGFFGRRPSFGRQDSDENSRSGLRDRFRDQGFNGRRGEIDRNNDINGDRHGLHGSSGIRDQVENEGTGNSGHFRRPYRPNSFRRYREFFPQGSTGGRFAGRGNRRDEERPQQGTDSFNRGAGSQSNGINPQGNGIGQGTGPQGNGIGQGTDLQGNGIGQGTGPQGNGIGQSTGSRGNGIDQGTGFQDTSANGGAGSVGTNGGAGSN